MEDRRRGTNARWVCCTVTPLSTAATDTRGGCGAPWAGRAVLGLAGLEERGKAAGLGARMWAGPVRDGGGAAPARGPGGSAGRAFVSRRGCGRLPASDSSAAGNAGVAERAAAAKAAGPPRRFNFFRSGDTRGYGSDGSAGAGQEPVEVQQAATNLPAGRRYAAGSRDLKGEPQNRMV